MTVPTEPPAPRRQKGRLALEVVLVMIIIAVIVATWLPAIIGASPK